MAIARPRRFACALIMLLQCALGSAQTPEPESVRLAAAERLFNLPSYRQLATRQIYETVRNLPPDQSQAAQAALRDPAVVNAMRQIISRAVANTYSLKEMEFLHRLFASPEMESFMRREGQFRDQLQREFTAALLTNPVLIRAIPPPAQR